jgi:hypothetical protein
MGKLNAKKRNALPRKDFGLPGAKGKGKAKGKYPMPDKEHAINAEARATQQEEKGHLSPEQAAEIRHKAKHVLGEMDSHYHNK